MFSFSFSVIGMSFSVLALIFKKISKKIYPNYETFSESTKKLMRAEDMNWLKSTPNFIFKNFLVLEARKLKFKLIVENIKLKLFY